MSILRFVSDLAENLTCMFTCFRKVDPFSGRIIIGGIDISTIGIQDLRSRLVRRESF